MSEKIGLCTACGEWTSVKEPCCGAGVWFEGGIEHWEDYQEDSDEEENKDSQT